MAISTGDTLPECSFVELGAEGPATVSGDELFKGRKVAVFAVPGAFTPTCNDAHMPSFVKNAEALKAKGVDEIACVSVNDPFVMNAWGESTGAKQAGIRMLADPEAKFAKALGLDFSAPPVGLIDRSKRYSMLVEGGVVKALNVEDNPGEATCSTGDSLLDQL